MSLLCSWHFQEFLYGLKCKHFVIYTGLVLCVHYSLAVFPSFVIFYFVYCGLWDWRIGLHHFLAICCKKWLTRILLFVLVSDSLFVFEFFCFRCKRYLVRFSLSVQSIACWLGCWTLLSQSFYLLFCGMMIVDSLETVVCLLGCSLFFELILKCLTLTLCYTMWKIFVLNFYRN